MGIKFDFNCRIKGFLVRLQTSSLSSTNISCFFFNGSVKCFGEGKNKRSLFSVVSPLLSNEQQYMHTHACIKWGALAPSCETILQHKIIVTIMFIVGNNTLKCWWCLLMAVHADYMWFIETHYDNTVFFFSVCVAGRPGVGQRTWLNHGGRAPAACRGRSLPGSDWTFPRLRCH